MGQVSKIFHELHFSAICCCKHKNSHSPLEIDIRTHKYRINYSICPVIFQWTGFPLPGYIWVEGAVRLLLSPGPAPPSWGGRLPRDPPRTPGFHSPCRARCSLRKP
ncbi:hypothetical protein DPEC_G00272560 [Dallia pectoralis]|uniref:Uncharacterized protein n=1 Tax=Dallia pectoralis TaxID=75939 RepID=A0ACC2FQF3_DALPE|nr:hypothetical protein DPEC_G00272560 [Dallia pectoralis]